MVLAASAVRQAQVPIAAAVAEVEVRAEAVLAEFLADRFEHAVDGVELRVRAFVLDVHLRAEAVEVDLLADSEENAVDGVHLLVVAAVQNHAEAAAVNGLADGGQGAVERADAGDLLHSLLLETSDWNCRKFIVND